MNYKIITDPEFIKRSDWDRFILNHPNGNIFQSSYYYYAIAKVDLYTPFFFCVIDEAEQIKGILVSVVYKQYKGLIGFLSSRSIIHGGPIILNSDANVLELLLTKYLAEIKSKAIFSQFRNSWIQSNEKSIFEEKNIFFEDHLDIIIDLTKDEEKLWKEIHSKRRNEIRRATKEGTFFRKAENISDFKSAYNILLEVYERVKVPIPPFAILNNIYTELSKENMIQCFLAINDDKIIGTMIAFTYNNIIFDWYAGAKKEFYKKYPNDLIPWEVFKWGKANGFNQFDFGGAGKPNQHYGVRDYKLKFGGKLVNFGRYEIVHKKHLFKIGKIGYYLFKKI